jgi:hypothetical protein
MSFLREMQIFHRVRAPEDVFEAGLRGVGPDLAGTAMGRSSVPAAAY